MIERREMFLSETFASFVFFAFFAISLLNSSSTTEWGNGEIMEHLIRFLLENFTLSFFVIGLIASAVSLWRRPRPLTQAHVVEDLFSYFLFFSVGVTFLYNFVCHIFLGDMSAKFIGWEPSPFQAEVGWASLGFSAVGLLAFRGSLGARAAAVIGPACFLLGASIGHIYQIIVANNFAPGNAGAVLYTDIGIPVVGLMLLWLHSRLGRETASTVVDTSEVVT